MSFPFPTSDQRTVLIGTTGSGKTQAGLWLESESDFDQRPHVLIDYKGDQLLGQIPYKKDISYRDKFDKPGLYKLAIMPGEEEKVEEFLWRVWHREHTHLYVDEGYMIDKFSNAFNALLTQGRSKRISMTILTQRPVACSRFVISEASHFCIFRMNDRRDKDTIQRFFPADLDDPQPPYWSRWYDVGADRTFPLMPVPDSSMILERFNERLKPKRRFI